MTTTIKNYNLSKLSGLTDLTNTLSNININNSIIIPKSSENTNSALDNINAGFFIKDINSNGSGDFYKIKVDSEPTSIPAIYFNNNEMLDRSNVLSTLEDILQDYTLDTSNLMITNGYINFANGSIPNTNQGSNGVGIRYSSNNTVQFKNYDTNWIDLVDIINHDEFKELVDVDVETNPLLNNQYIIYNSTTEKFVNANLSIVNDTNPTLAGDLNIGDYLIQFGDTENRLVYNAGGIIDNNLIVLKNNSTLTNNYSYLEINNADIIGIVNPAIIAKSTYEDSNVGIELTTLNSGHINLNAMTGNVNVNATHLIVNGDAITSNMYINGFTKNSIYRTSNKQGGYVPATYWDVPLTTDTILFNFNNSSSNGSYYANVGVGVDGQKLNLIFNSTSTNINVNVFFGTNKLIVGTGFANGLTFNTSGQSSSLIYLAEDIDAWQALNTGSNIF